MKKEKINNAIFWVEILAGLLVPFAITYILALLGACPVFAKYVTILPSLAFAITTVIIMILVIVAGERKPINKAVFWFSLLALAGCIFELISLRAQFLSFKAESITSGIFAVICIVLFILSCRQDLLYN